MDQGLGCSCNLPIGPAITSASPVCRSRGDLPILYHPESRLSQETAEATLTGAKRLGQARATLWESLRFGENIYQASAKAKSLLCLPSPGVKPAARKVSQSWGHKWWELSVWSRSDDGLAHLLTFPQRALNSTGLPYRCELTLGPIRLMSPTVDSVPYHCTHLSPAT